MAKALTMADEEGDELKDVPVRIVTYENESSSNVRFVLEPWADEYEIKSGKKVELRIEEHGPQEGTYLEICSRDDCLVVFAGGHQVIYVMSDGKELDSVPPR